MGPRIGLHALKEIKISHTGMGGRVCGVPTGNVCPFCTSESSGSWFSDINEHPLGI
jgi:hypothetical protein